MHVSSQFCFMDVKYGRPLPKIVFSLFWTIGPDPGGPLQTYFGMEKNDKKELKPYSYLFFYFKHLNIKDAESLPCFLLFFKH